MAGAAPPTPPSGAVPAAAQRMRRPQRRVQILTAATRAFARTGYRATSLDDIAAEAGISRVILYRHFDSKTDLYRAVLDRTCQRLAATVGTGDYTADSIAALLRAAADDPDGFRLLFRHARHESEFRDLTETLATAAAGIADHHLTDAIPDRRWRAWASDLTATVAIEAVIAWLDAGQPDPDHAAVHIGHVISAISRTARTANRPPPPNPA